MSKLSWYAEELKFIILRLNHDRKLFLPYTVCQNTYAHERNVSLPEV